MTAKETLISVIIPIYNISPYLPRCLDSIVGQTYKNLEIILVDDGSTDNSLEICQQYAAKDKRIQVIHQENQGVSAARNTGLDNVHGEFIAFADPDDWLALDAMEQYMEAARKTGAPLLCGEHLIVPEGTTPKTQTAEPLHSDYPTWSTEKWLRVICAHSDFGVCNKLFSRHLIQNHRFTVHYKQGEDLAFLTSLLPFLRQIGSVPQTVYFYYQRSNSSQRTGSILTQQYNQEIGQKLYDTCQQCGFTSALPAALGVWLLSTALYGGYILLYDSKNEYKASLQNVVNLFRKHRKFIFNNSVIWQPAKFCIQMWSLFPTFTRMFCRFPGINGYLRYQLRRFVGSHR